MRQACERFHDHVANIYDDIYKRTPYWDFYHDLSWSLMREHLPRDLSVEVHDAGCGTGIYGLKLLAAGFRTLLSDLSARMLDVARRKTGEAGYLEKASFLKLDITDQSVLDDGRFGLICAQGDPLSLCAEPKKALKEMARTLAPGGKAVVSVDHRAAGYDHYLEKADLQGLLGFHKTGVSTWLAERKDERFPFRAFFPDEIRKMAEAADLKVVSVTGKTVLPLRKHPDLLNDRAAYKALMRIERKLGGRETLWGRASHLQAVLLKEG